MSTINKDDYTKSRLQHTTIYLKSREYLLRTFNTHTTRLEVNLEDCITSNV